MDRYKAASEGVSVRDVANAVQSAIDGKTVGKYIKGDNEQDIRLRLKTREKTTPDDLNELAIVSKYEDIVKLGRIAAIMTGHAPREIIRNDRQRNFVLHADIAGATITSAQDEALDTVAGVSLPRGYEVKPGLLRLEINESVGNLFLAIMLASFLVYTILVIQFESLTWPLVVFSAAPASIVGWSIALNINREPVNILVLIGAVILIGISVNMSILMIATINGLRKRGSSLQTAITEGTSVRLRPILMTTATTVFGALPICMASGAANQLNQPLALTIITGILSSAAFKLFGLPVVYQLVAKSFPQLKP